MKQEKNNTDTHEQIEFIARTVSQNMNKIVDIQNTLDKLVTTTVDSMSKIESIQNTLKNFTTKDDHQEIMNGIDSLVKLAKNKDEEIIMMSHGMKRMHDEIDKLKGAISLT